MHLSRRSLLAGAGSLAVSAALAPRIAKAASGQKVLRLQTRQIEVGGKPVTRYGVHQASGAFGLILDEGDDIDVRLENGLSVPSGLHWHGFDTPWRQDGVPYISGPPIEPGRSADYKFPAVPAGTRWMHSHFGLQEQDLLAAPLIVRERSAIKRAACRRSSSFSKISPGPTHRRCSTICDKPKSGGMDMSKPGGMDMSKPDLNDIDYDAYLANERTLADPEVIDVERNGEVRLRIINAGASTNFHRPRRPRRNARCGRRQSDRAAQSEAISARGRPTRRHHPPDARRRERRAGARPWRGAASADGRRASAARRGRGEDSKRRRRGGARGRIGTGTPAPRDPATAGAPGRPFGPGRSHRHDGGYIWGMPVNGLGGVPVTVARGERVELAMRNVTMMAHPMHLHGHSFQVTEVAGQRLSGAMRDSILVPPKTTVKVVFDANNPGLWAFHCHNPFHMVAGMFATVVYDGFS